MYGAILGDMIGSPYEFKMFYPYPNDNFTLLNDDSEFTDDTVLTVAIADALINADEFDRKKLPRFTGPSENWIRERVWRWGCAYPDAGYGGMFLKWLDSHGREPYYSYGNGSAMRVSSVGWIYDSLKKTQEVAKETAIITHNHPEGIKGAVAVASIIWMARNGRSKDEIRKYVAHDLHYYVPEMKTIYESQVRTNHYSEFEKTISPEDVSCQKTVPIAISAFLEGDSFEDVIRKAVCVGGDTDTIAAIAGSMAEAMYDIPEELKNECRNRLPESMLKIVDQFEKIKKERKTNHE